MVHPKTQRGSRTENLLPGDSDGTAQETEGIFAFRVTMNAVSSAWKTSTTGLSRIRQAPGVFAYALRKRRSFEFSLSRKLLYHRRIPEDKRSLNHY